MRGRSPVQPPCLVIAALVILGGCSTDEPTVLAAPEPEARSPSPLPIPEPPLDPPRGRCAVVISGACVARVVDEAVVRDADDIGDVATPTMTRLVYQCSDEVTFAVRTAGNTIEVFPPGFTLGYIVLYRQPADLGVRYTREHAEFRGSGELATLIIGNERYVDCVSNPAAAVWATVPRAPTGR